MKAMILAAGFGTRLRPLSGERPKVLMPVANTPVMARVIEYLKGHGVTGIIVNAHHHQQQVVQYLQTASFGLNLQVRVESRILGTGGGIRNTADFWDREPFVVINGDILTDIDLTGAYEAHRKSRPIATMVLHDQPPFNKIRLDAAGNVMDIPREYDQEGFAFTGIHILEPDIFSCIPDGFSDIVDVYRDLMDAGRTVRSHISTGHYWYDVGSLPDYMRANRDLVPQPFTVGPGCEIHPSVKLTDWAVIGDGCRLEEGVELARAILWEGVVVGRGVRVADSVVTREGICPVA
jgi:mannose-1-phosphate guanylyltransferase